MDFLIYFFLNKKRLVEVKEIKEDLENVAAMFTNKIYHYARV
jgi:hypothetical protein